MIIKDLEKREDLIFVDTDTEVWAIKSILGEEVKEFDSFFVKINDGDYSEIYGMYGLIPYLKKEVIKIK